jgi:hypothetical protein
MDSEDFLELVYGDREGWIDLPAKVGPYWVPYHLEWEGEATTAVSRRIDSCLRDEESLYFSVTMFREKGRDYDDAMGTHWLWADLDEVNPAVAGRHGILPTVAWSSSPGRYQALWALDSRLSPKALEKVNRALSYFLGADRGGWDLTQVLRLPGTRNYKYPGGPPVEVLWLDPDLIYSPRDVWNVVRSADTDEVRLSAGEGLPRRPLPARARALLRVPADSVVEGERSARLWQIECLLAEAGWGEDDIYAAVWDCAWNKWASVGTGERRLRREIRKALNHVRRRVAAGDSVESRRGHDEDTGEVGEGEAGEVDGQEGDAGGRVDAEGRWIRYASFMAMEMPEPKWLVEGIWTAGSHGIIGGEPKTSKTTLALALAMAVASGRPMLGRFSVGTPGPVLMVQEENAPWMMQDRMRKIASSMGLIQGVTRASGPGSLGPTTVDLEFPHDLPIRLLNNSGFDLGDEECRELLEEEVADVRPVLVILDPLYLMFGSANTDKSHEIVPFLKWLLRLRYEYEVAIALVHHFRKQTVGMGVVRPGQRVMGSGMFHGWVDSAMYASALEPKHEADEKKMGVHLELEFRSMAPRRPLEMWLEMDEPGGLGFKASVEEYNLTSLIVSLIRDEPGVTAKALAEATGVDMRVVLGRARDATTEEGERLIAVTSSKNGRGRSFQLWPSGYEGQDG